MIHNRKEEDAGLPAEIDLLIFKAAEIKIALDTVQVDCIISAEQAEQQGIFCVTLNKVPLLDEGTSALYATVILLKNQTCGIRVDGLDAIITVPIEAIQPIPEPLSYFSGPRIFCGVVQHEKEIVLLIDPYRLKGLNPCEAVATA